MIDLEIVAVHPSRQGHYVGESLVQFGMDEARDRQVPCYLEATPAGFPVYQKLGWNQVDSDVDIDLRKYAGNDTGYGIYTFRSMLVLPNKKG